MWKEDISTAIYVQGYNMYWQSFAVKNSGILRLALIFNLSNPGMKILNVKNWIKIQEYLFEVDWLRQFTKSQVTCVLFQQGPETLIHPQARPFWEALSLSVDSVTLASYCCTLSLSFSCNPVPLDLCFDILYAAGASHNMLQKKFVHVEVFSLILSFLGYNNHCENHWQ